MKRRTKWIIGLAAGIPVVLIGGAVLLLLLTSEDPEMLLSSIETRDLPSGWTEEATEQPLQSAADTMQPPTLIEETAPSLDDLGLPINGTLVVRRDGSAFGEETFQLALDGDRVELQSNGRFWFKASIATITIAFDLTMLLDSQLRPYTFSSNFDAPLGFGRSMQAEFEDARAIVRSGSDVSEYAIELDQAFVLGTFSTYAIIPLLYELRQPEGIVSFDVLLFGRPMNREENAAGDRLPKMWVERIEDGDIRHNDRVLTVSRYRISGDMGDMILYAHGTELLGIVANSDEGSMFVYRADYFEDGFEVVDPPRRQ